ncbi:MAG: hypothetical protein C5B57_01480, partial [Blastocatellia bacterium]
PGSGIRDPGSGIGDRGSGIRDPGSGMQRRAGSVGGSLVTSAPGSRIPDPRTPDPGRSGSP